MAAATLAPCAGVPVKREPAALESHEFDLLVVGGGIFGACAALDATQRGLSVALIERADFGSGTSAHSFKMIHGGIRYLQHLDLVRIRQSAAARRTFLRVAPHLSMPLPIVVPTYGLAMKSKWVMRLGMAAYDLLTLDRNRGVTDPSRRIPAGRTLSRAEVLARYPGLASRELSGAAVFCDGQMYNPPRLVLSFVRSAAEGGAVVANHVEVRKLLREGSRVCGLEARDALSGETLRARAKVVLNAAGPQAEGLAASGLGRPLEPPTPWSRDACFVVGRAVVPGDHALAIPARSKDPGALLSRGERQLFLVPWHGSTLVGVWHKVHTGHPDAFCVSEAELAAWIDEVNGTYPGAALTLDEVRMVNAGLIPFGENDAEAGDLHFGHRSRLIDHRRDHQIDGLITLIGVRYTTGPEEAALAVDRVFDQLGRRAPRSRLDTTPVAGGDIDDFEALVAHAKRERPDSLAASCVRPLVHLHGTRYPELFSAVRACPALGRTVGDTDTPAVSVVHAVRDEMAQTLADVVLRRTDLGTAGVADDAGLRACAELLAAELGWDPARIAQERAGLEAGIPAVLRSRARGSIP